MLFLIKSKLYFDILVLHEHIFLKLVTLYYQQFHFQSFYRNSGTVTFLWYITSNIFELFDEYIYCVNNVMLGKLQITHRVTVTVVEDLSLLQKLLCMLYSAVLNECRISCALYVSFDRFYWISLIISAGYVFLYK